MFNTTTLNTTGRIFLSLNRQEIGFGAVESLLYILVFIRAMRGNKMAFVLLITGLGLVYSLSSVVLGVLFNWVEFGEV